MSEKTMDALLVGLMLVGGGIALELGFLALGALAVMGR